MKKTTRVLVALLALTLVTSCFVGGTFAKYVTKGPGATDSARVAKWGVTITGTGVMFNDSYKDEFTTYTASEATGEITVQAAVEDTNVVAPGTTGTLAALDIAGTPEVDTQVSYVADLALANWEVAGAYYCPIVITVNGTAISGLDYASATLFEEAVEDAIEAKAAVYHTNTDLSTVEDDVQVSWAWAFEGADNGNAVDGQNDVKDTALGDAATPATIALTLTATITQID